MRNAIRITYAIYLLVAVLELYAIRIGNAGTLSIIMAVLNLLYLCFEWLTIQAGCKARDVSKKHEAEMQKYKLDEFI